MSEGPQDLIVFDDIRCLIEPNWSQTGLKVVERRHLTNWDKASISIFEAVVLSFLRPQRPPRLLPVLNGLLFL